MDNVKAESNIEQTFTNYLKDNKLRRTPERYAILKAVYSINGSFDIETLLDYLEENIKFRVSRATVYNTIALLIDANLVIHHIFGSISKYEKCYNKELSYTICTKCGKIAELHNMKLNESLRNNIKKFNITHYSLYMYGLCNKCERIIKKKQEKEKKLVTITDNKKHKYERKH